MAEIRLESVRKTFGRVIAARDVSLTVGDGEFLVLLGPSGCGKTTLLRCVAGLEQVDAGRVHIGQRDVTDDPPRARHIGMVFQSYAVFPHLRVFDNIGFGLKMQRRPQDEIKRRVHYAAELLQLGELLERYPAQLSGGQRQRVAVARAIAVEPQVLLMDEPLSNLDALLRLQTRAELKRLHKEIKATTLYVTHDQVEALSLGDRIAVMKDGQIVQCDTPMKIYDEPASVFVGSFIGTPPMNFLRGTVQASDGQVAVHLGDFRLQPAEDMGARLKARSDQGVLVGIRPENIVVHLKPAAQALRSLVLVVEPLGSHKLLTVQAGKETLKVTTRADAPVEANQEVWLEFEAGKIRWLEQTSGQAL